MDIDWIAFSAGVKDGIAIMLFISLHRRLRKLERQ